MCDRKRRCRKLVHLALAETASPIFWVSTLEKVAYVKFVVESEVLASEDSSEAFPLEVSIDVRVALESFAARSVVRDLSSNA